LRRRAAFVSILGFVARPLISISFLIGNDRNSRRHH
jgi:hypothetical protein